MFVKRTVKYKYKKNRHVNFFRVSLLLFTNLAKVRAQFIILLLITLRLQF